MGREKFEKLYLRGDLNELKSLTTDRALELGVVDLCILAEALAGDFSRALWHAEALPPLPASQMAAIHFALGVGWTRLSEYKKAKIEFARLSRYRGNDSRARFFLYQAVGFFHFFSGKHLRSVQYADKALKLATRSAYEFGRQISLEVLALARLESGLIHLGLKNLREARELALQFGNAPLAASFELNLVLYEARFGVSSSPLRHLTEALQRLKPEDTYSRNSVRLELANQMILHGQASEAQRTLEEASDAIYASRNRRQIAMLGFRLSFLLYLKGSRDAALHLLRSAEHHLHKEVDRGLLSKMRGLRSRLEKRNSPPPTHWKFGEDKIGDLVQSVRRKQPEALNQILKSGRLHLLYSHFDLEPDQSLFAFDLLPRGGAVVLDRGDVRVFPKGLSNTLQKILRVLSIGYTAKEELVASVWGYEYDPLRHDPLIYTSLSKLRAVLGEYGAWVENDHRGYRLRTGVRIWSPSDTTAAQPELLPALHSGHSHGFALNIRALRILAWLDSQAPGTSLNADFVRNQFHVSRATATRDLNELVSKGLLRKIGKARATVYLKGDL